MILMIAFGALSALGVGTWEILRSCDRSFEFSQAMEDSCRELAKEMEAPVWIW